MQIVTSILLTLYTQLAFESVGYEWTFIIMGFIATSGSVVTFFYPEQISSEDFRERYVKKREEIGSI